MKQDERNSIIHANAKIVHRYMMDIITLAIAHGLDPFLFLHATTTGWLEQMEPFMSSANPDRITEFLRSIFVFDSQPDE